MTTQWAIPSCGIFIIMIEDVYDDGKVIYLRITESHSVMRIMIILYTFMYKNVER